MYQYSFANVDLIIEANYAGKPSAKPSNLQGAGLWYR